MSATSGGRVFGHHPAHGFFIECPQDRQRHQLQPAHTFIDRMCRFPVGQQGVRKDQAGGPTRAAAHKDLGHQAAIRSAHHADALYAFPIQETDDAVNQSGAITPYARPRPSIVRQLISAIHAAPERAGTAGSPRRRSTILAGTFRYNFAVLGSAAGRAIFRPLSFYQMPGINL